MYKAHFIAPTPRFGRQNNRLPIGHQQRSPYYWWWAYLRRNTAYLECCESGGKGALASLYEDFGDVREDNFHQWWTADGRGATLFAEPPLETHLTALTAPSEWKKEWTEHDVMLIAVPLRVSKRSLINAFRKALDQRHIAKRGRPTISQMRSKAKYKLERNYTIANLQNTLAVYDLWQENLARPKPERLALWELAKELGINRTAIKQAESRLRGERYIGRNTLAATVSRYIKQAKEIIENTSIGRFPLC